MKALISKLNPVSKKALEGAASLCVLKTHAVIDLPHYLSKLLDAVDSDMSTILSYYRLDKSMLLKQCLLAVDRQAAGHMGSPVFAHHLMDLLEKAWLISSLWWGQSQIRSGAVLYALLTETAFSSILQELFPILLTLPQDRLTKDITDLLRASKEVLSDSPLTQSTLIDSLGNLSQRALDLYTVDMTQQAKDNKLDPIFGRDAEIRQVMDILCRRRQNNPILLGEAGVGKTAIVEGFVQNIVQNQVPHHLKDHHVHLLDLSLMQAGASAKGQFEERLHQLLNDIKNAANPIILFIDEVHTLMGAGGQQGLGDAANLLKPALARGEIRTIGATTWVEYKRYIEKDAALVRRFEKVKVCEPTEAQTVSMLQLLTPRLSEHHQVMILSEAIEAAVSLSTRFLPERRLPDKALSVLDTACAQVALSQHMEPQALQSLKSAYDVQQQVRDKQAEEILLGFSQGLVKEMKNVEVSEIDHLQQVWQIQTQHVQQANALRETLKKQWVENHQQTSPVIESLSHQLKTMTFPFSERQLVAAAVDRSSVANVMSDMTGIPLTTLQSSQTALSYTALAERLQQYVIGQPLALQEMSRYVMNYQAGLTPSDKPMGVFLLAGPSGVGKTETAHALAYGLMGHAQGLLRLNMGEFQEAHSIATLKGAPPGYVGYGQGGVLTESVRQNPYRVVLLDEFDRAHCDIMSFFAHIFDKGVAEDSEGVEVDFSHCLFVLTTNVGADLIQSRLKTLKQTEDQALIFEQLAEKLMALFTENFGTALAARVKAIPYFPLSYDSVREIVRFKIQEIARMLYEKHLLTFRYDAAFVEQIAGQFSGHIRGIRALDAYLAQHVLPKLAAKIAEMGESNTFERIITAEQLGGF